MFRSNISFLIQINEAIDCIGSINLFIASNLSPGHFWQLSKINRHWYLQLFKQIHNSAVVERRSRKQTVPGSNPGQGNYQKNCKIYFFNEDDVCLEFHKLCDPSGRQIFEDKTLCAETVSSSEAESTFQLRGGKYFPPQRRKVLSSSEAESDSIQTWKQIQYIKSHILNVDRRSLNVDRQNEALGKSLERGLAYKKKVS